MTYRSVLANREFAALLVSQTLSLLGDQITRIAVAVLVFSKTDSALAAAATFATSYLTYLAVGPILSSVADRYDRRVVMVLSDLARAAVVAVLATAHVPLAALFLLLVALSAVTPAFDSARGATLPDVLPGESYVRGNALANVAFQSAQICGFLTGGALLAATSARQALLIDCASFLVSAGAVLGTLRSRPLPARDEGTSLWRETLEGFRIVAQHPRLRKLLAFALLSAMAVSAPEALAVPVAHSAGGGTVAAGLLTATIPAGFVLASFLILRVDSERRERLLPALVLLSAVPLMATPFTQRVGLVVTLWLIAGMGSALQLVASAAYVQSAPEQARARAYGVASTLLVASQGVAQLLAGGISNFFDRSSGARAAVAILAAATLLPLPWLRRAGSPLPLAQEISG